MIEKAKGMNAAMPRKAEVENKKHLDRVK